MRNFGEEYFYHREISIWNPEFYLQQYREDKLASKRQKRKSSRKARTYDVQFFPEGGYMVGGTETRVGVKALNDLGLGVPVDGKILNKKNRVVANFESSDLGMGSFVFNPVKGDKYTAEFLIDGKRNRVALPEVQNSGYHLALQEYNGDGLKVRIGSTYEAPTILLACHMRGKLLFSSEMKLGGGDMVFDIPTRSFPSGILHITLFDSNRDPRCERLVFIDSEDRIDLSIRQDKQEYGPMEPVDLVLVARDADGNPVRGQFSLAVSDRDLDNNAGDFQAGIISNLLLASDIPGRIERPDYYFLNRDTETQKALDDLLLTQGWRRFEWDDVIYQNPLEIDYKIQKGLVVQGKVTREVFDIPLKNIPVTLTVLSEFNDVFITRTDNRGRYNFELPDYEDTIQVEITARRLNGKKNLVIYLEDSDQEEANEIFSSYSSQMIVQGTNTLKPLEEPEVDSMQSRLEGIYHTPDYVLHVDDNMRTFNSVLDMIQGRVPGVMVSGNSVQIRGPSSIHGSNEPLFLIDNVPTDVGAVQALNPADIERIEFLKGPSSAIYGVRGANGVIAIYTLRGRFMQKGILEFEMLGYHKPGEFYSPRYGTQFDDLVRDERSSLYWNPSVFTDSTGTARIRFYNADRKSRFYITVEGITRDGKIGQTERSYTVN
jgi:TonB-dependent SusC/RagA subfamily outer membrane receptor